MNTVICFHNRDEKYKLLADGADISNFVGGLSWQNTTSELATKMNFEVAKSDTRYVTTYTPQVGSIINWSSIMINNEFEFWE
ncbi:MAG: hypothetical protein IJH37_06230 [Clostridia bacterium]|nr:hypothetical protein [Clostridia bacterium]